MTRSRQTADWGSRAGLAKIIPSSVAVGSGTGSADSLGTITFTTVSSVSLNGIFSSIYDNYFINYSIDGSTSITALNMRYRVSGSDNSSSNYSSGTWGYNSENTAGLVFNDGALTTTIAIGAVKSSSDACQGQFFIYSPFSSSKKTQWNGAYSFIDTNYRGRNFAGNLSVTTSYDGVTIYPASGTITGTISVYGYTK